MGRIRHISDLFDEHHEIAAWVVLVTAIGLRVADRLDQWPFVAMVCAGLVTLLGSAYFAGVKVGPSGIEVDK